MNFTSSTRAAEDRSRWEGIIIKSSLVGWLTCDFTSFLTAFQSYQNDVRMIMKGCVQWNSVNG